ncbi:hypothetical protein FOA52_011304 [Chlamydomonas sp. UWO 241]|nr:hypothetical protein FOA52_011304 [Chlamydomonas sp. UWO 241]
MQPCLGAGAPRGLPVMDGLRVVESGSALGRVVVATRGFEAGEVVLAERAALVWVNEGVGGLLWAFSRAECDTQEAVLEMFHPALDSEAASAALNTGDQLLLRALHEVQVPFEVAQRLWLVANFNCHELESKDSALFVIGSKVEHSCLPNTSYGSRADQLIYTAVRPIAAGDRISFAYVPTSQQDTQERRELLHTTRLFLCACERCEGPDVSRPLPCPACSDGVTLRTLPAESIRSSATGDSPALQMAQLKKGAGATWTCLSCSACATDAEMSAAIEKEAELVADLKQRTLVPDVSPGMLCAAQRQQVLLHLALPPMHHLHARFSELVSKFAASEADLAKDMPPGVAEAMVRAGTMLPVQQLQWEAAVSAVELIVWRERSQAVPLGRMQPQATWQPGGAATQLELPPQARLAHILDSVWSGSDEAAALQPCWDSAWDAVHAGVDLVDAGSAADAAPVFRRYRDAMFSQLSNDGTLRRFIQGVLDSVPPTESRN